LKIPTRKNPKFIFFRGQKFLDGNAARKIAYAELDDVRQVLTGCVSQALFAASPAFPRR